MLLRRSVNWIEFSVEWWIVHMNIEVFVHDEVVRCGCCVFTNFTSIFNKSWINRTIYTGFSSNVSVKICLDPYGFLSLILFKTSPLSNMFPFISSTPNPFPHPHPPPSHSHFQSHSSSHVSTSSISSPHPPHRMLFTCETSSSTNCKDVERLTGSV